MIVGKPAYGGSKHTATVLLHAMRCMQGARAAIVVAYMEECIEAVKEHGRGIIRVGPHDSPEKLLDDIAGRLASEPGCGNAGALVDLGGLGLEPVIYIFAETAVEAAERALDCLRRAGRS